MSTEIKKRFDRILSIFIQLQTSRIITAATLANKYEVSLRTIYRDVQALIAAGIPIYGEAGTGYAILSEYRMPALPFTREEALSLLAAEKLVAKYTDKNLGGHFASAIAKMKASLRPSEKSDLHDTDPAIAVRTDRDTFNQELPDGLSLLIESIASGKVVHIVYQKPMSDTPDSRALEPVGIFVEGRFWYVMAYCQLRQDYRQFRLDRIKHIRLGSDPFQGKHPGLAYFLEKKEAVPKKRFVIRVDRAIAHYLHWDRQHYGYVGEQLIGDEVEMYFETNMPDEGFARWFLMFADQARIMEPKPLIELASQIMMDSLDKLNTR